MMVAERKNTRGRIEIMASILFHCREGIKKTHIMCKANIGYEPLCYYLPNLIDTRLVKQDIQYGSVIYRTTDAGRQFLDSYFDIVKLLDQNNDNQMTQLTTIENTVLITKDVKRNLGKSSLVTILEESED